jgi:hypothetical protein
MNAHSHTAKRLAALALIAGAAGMIGWTWWSGEGGWLAHAICPAVIAVAVVGLVRPDLMQLTEW